MEKIVIPNTFRGVPKFAGKDTIIDRYRATNRVDEIIRAASPVEEKPVWRGDHSFNSDAATYSLLNFIEPEVAKEHTNWSNDEVRKEAIIRFETRLRQDLAYEQKESAHEETVLIWQPVETQEKTWELATQYGDRMVTLSELWEHTKEYAAFTGNSAAYNQKEHEAQLAMQEELLSGNARAFVSALSHPDSIRYVQVWQKTSDGAIESKQIDLYKTTGRDFSHQEGEQLIQHLSVFHDGKCEEASEGAGYTHFFVYEKDVREQDIRVIAMAQTMEGNSVSSSEIIPGVPNRVVDVGFHTLRDTGESMRQLTLFLKDHIDKKIQQMRRNLGEDSGDVIRMRKQMTAPVDGLVRPHVPVVREIGQAVKVGKGVMSELHTESITGIQSILTDWWIARALLEKSDTVSVGPVAALFWLTRIDDLTPIYEAIPADALPEENTCKTPSVLSPIETLRKSLTELFRLPKYFSEVKNGQGKKNPALRSLQRIGKPVGRRQEFRLTETVIPVNAVFSIERWLAVMFEMAKNTFVRETNGPVSMEKLRESREVYKRKTTPDTERIKQNLTRRWTFAVLAWWIVETHHEKRMLPDAVSFGEGVNQPLVSKGPKPYWILLSIIWYLAAIREHGKSSHPQKKKKTKKAAIRKFPAGHVPLPPSGIIFAYGS